MKKFLTAFVCFAGIALFADTNLIVQSFLPAKNGKSEVVKLFWKTKGLQITADKDKDALVTYNQYFTFYAGMIYEISGDYSGEGQIFVEMQLFNADNTPYKVPVKRVDAVIDGDDFEAKIDLRDIPASDAPRRFKVVIGVRKGGSVLLDDMEIDWDND